MKSGEQKLATTQIVSKSNPKDKQSANTGELVIGLIVDFNSPGQPMVSYPGINHEHAVSALTTIPISKDSIGRQVALLFTDGEFKKPVVIGLIQSCLDEMKNENTQENTQTNVTIQVESKNVETKVDGERLVFEAEREIELKCGKSSIILTRAGKILIRGKYLSTRSTGVNRIKGGSVLIN